jgi:hypothetical protein
MLVSDGERLPGWDCADFLGQAVPEGVPANADRRVLSQGLDHALYELAPFLILSRLMESSVMALHGLGLRFVLLPFGLFALGSLL